MIKIVSKSESLEITNKKRKEKEIDYLKQFTHFGFGTNCILRFAQSLHHLRTNKLLSRPNSRCRQSIREKTVGDNLWLAARSQSR
jgi:hypothetical protein